MPDSSKSTQTSVEFPEPWRSHQAFRYGLVEAVPTNWVQQWRHPAPTPYADAIDGSVHRLASFERLLRREGVREPILIRVGADKGRARVEAGNHRCVVAERCNIPVLPCVVQVLPSIDFDAGNGAHAFSAEAILDWCAIEGGGKGSFWMAPSQVFRDLVPSGGGYVRLAMLEEMA